MTDLKTVTTAQKKREPGLATAVYFLTTHSSDGDILDWWCLYPHLDGCISQVHPKLALPEDFKKLRFFGNAWCDMKAFFIGGLVWDKQDPFRNVYSSDVFMYEPILEKWSKGAPLKLARSFPTVIVIEKKIYVFGGDIKGITSASEYSNEPSPDFAECFVVGYPNRGWKFLPTSPLAPPFRRVTYHAIYERQHLILLWFVRGKARPPCVLLYAYDYESGEWVKPPYIDKESGPFLINPPVIVGDVIIWHHFGTIFGYDLITTQRTVLATVPGVSFCQPLYENMRSPQAFLLLVGKSKLCLMWHERDGEKRVHCYKYQIQMMTSSSDAEFSGLHFADFQQLDVPGFGIRNVTAAPLWVLCLGERIIHAKKAAYTRRNSETAAKNDALISSKKVELQQPVTTNG